jgi:hypothetical protein
MPMFHSPAEKVISTPAVVSRSGDQEIRMVTKLSREPKAPLRMLQYARNGGAPAAASSPIVSNTARSSAPA